MFRCTRYCGVACVDGICSNELREEYGYEPITCDICPYYKGCKDCMLHGTAYCKFVTEEGKTMEVKVIKIKFVKDGMEEISYINGGDWIDLRVAEDIHLEPNEFRLLPLGVAMKLPKNHEALVIPRSSTFKKYGIIQANSVGLIDETYCGENDEWCFPAYATRAVDIPKNTRICQFRIFEHQPPIDLVKVDKLTSKNRGGFGSTGEK